MAPGGGDLEFLLISGLGVGKLGWETGISTVPTDFRDNVAIHSGISEKVVNIASEQVANFDWNGRPTSPEYAAGRQAESFGPAAVGPVINDLPFSYPSLTPQQPHAAQRTQPDLP